MTINDYQYPELQGLMHRGESGQSGFRERLGRISKKTGTRGKSRFTIEIAGEPLLHQWSGSVLGQGPAQAIQDYIQHRIRADTRRVKLSTYETRQNQHVAFERGDRWAVKRFSGGRTGPTPPQDTTQMFNHSGRLANGIFARENKTDESWSVNVPANRLDPSTFRTRADFERMLGQLAKQVPEILRPQDLGQVPEVRKAIVDAIDDIIIRERGRTAGLQRQVRSEMMRALRQGAGILTGPIGI